MSEELKNIKELQELYSQDFFFRVAEGCTDRIKAGETDKDTYLLFAKSLLKLSTYATIEENKDSITQSFGNAASKASTVEEAFDVEYEALYEINDWEKVCIKNTLSSLEKSPSFDKWNAFAHIPANAAELKLFINISIRNKPIIKSQADAESLSLSDFAKKYGKTPDNNLSDQEKYSLVYDSACKIYHSAQTHLEGNNRGSREFVIETAKTALLGYMISLGMIDYCTSEQCNDTKEVLLERLYMQDKIYRSMLDAVIYPNGGTISILSGDRLDYIIKMNNLHEKISLLDPFFQPERLPNRTGINIQQPSPDGGCYVATAVYGSYDCPEVWTLRRFRDYTLAETWYGRAFIRTYYAISPTLVKWFGHTEWFKLMWKGRLDRMVQNLQKKGFENTPYEDKKW